MRRLLVLVPLIVAALITGWPLDHVFSTYTWPGPFGWIAHNTPGNIVAGFLQVGMGFMAGYGAHRLGVFDRLRSWATKDLHSRLSDLEESHSEIHRSLTTINRPMSARTLNASISASPWFRWAGTLVFGYEAIGLQVGFPTISMCCWKRPLLSVPVMGALFLHLYFRPESFRTPYAIF